MILLLPRLLRLGLRLVFLVVAALVVYLVVSAVQVYQASTRDQAAPAQAIVVLGAAHDNGKPGADFAARLDHAYQLWQHGYASLLAVTGGRQPDENAAEGDVGRAYLVGKGIPAAEVVADDTGTDTWSSLASVAKHLEARGDTKVILVADPYLDARMAAIATQDGLQPLLSPTRTSPTTGASTVPDFAKESVALALGRIVGFSRLAGAGLAVAGNSAGPGPA